MEDPQMLAEAYAAGRLDRAEFDERTEVVARARTLGELPAMVSDLVPVASSSGVPGSRATRSEALWRLLTASRISSALCIAAFAITRAGFLLLLVILIVLGSLVVQMMLMRQRLVEVRSVSAERRRAAERQTPSTPVDPTPADV